MATCFVVQGFGEKTDYTNGKTYNLDRSYDVVKEAVIAAGLDCRRADEIVHAGTIDVPMYEQLLRADLVVADLSTYNVNAAFELGVRYALKPRATIVIAEEGFKNPFDVNHIAITRYKHLGEDIGRREAERFRAELADRIRVIVAEERIDSPVYTFLTRLEPPEEKAGVAAAAAAPAAPAAQAQAQTFKLLMDGAMAKIAASDFAGAKSLLELARLQGPGDPFVVQKLALATYKAKQPTPMEALLAAHQLLQTLDPATTNDPETLGLWGAVHKRLWDLDRQPRYLDEAVGAYSRGFYLRQDHYNGVNYAYLLELRALQSARAGAFEDAIADRVMARRTRVDVIRWMTPQMADLAALPPEGQYWLQASMWEAALGLGRADEAAAWEAKARALLPADWMLQSTQEQLQRVRDTQAELAALLKPLLG
ncbi:MAG: tetratricopeptide repeat-containing protein [Rubrivivax sp.]